MIHALPLWFLIVSLFIPRIALFCAWLERNLVPFHLFGLGPADPGGDRAAHPDPCADLPRPGAFGVVPDPCDRAGVVWGGSGH